MAIGEIAFLSPWIAAPLVAALIDGARRAARDERRLFLVCLALPTIVVFTLTPLWGAQGLPHWPMPGWLFVYPLMGAWLAEPRAAALSLRRWAIVSAALLAALAVLVVGAGGDRLGRAPRSARFGRGRPDARNARLGRVARGARCPERRLRRRDQMDGRRQDRASRSGRESRCSSFPTIRAASRFLPTAPTSSAATRRSSSPGTGCEAAEARLAPYFAGFDRAATGGAAARRARRNRAGGHSGARLDARLSPAVSALRRRARIARAPRASAR